MCVVSPNCPIFALTVARVALLMAVPVVPDNVKSEPVTEIERTWRGKFRVLISKVTNPEQEFG